MVVAARTMPSTQTKKVELSFTNWVVGGSLVSVKSTESSRSRHRSRRVVVEEVDSEDEPISTKHKKNPPTPPGKSHTRKVAKGIEAKEKEKTEEKKKDDKKEKANEAAKDEKSKDDKAADDIWVVEKKCKTCGKLDTAEESECIYKEKCKGCGKFYRPADADEKEKAALEAVEKEKKEAEEKKEDSEKKDEGKKGDDDKKNDKTDGKGWTEEQDKKIMGMKAAGKSWKDIALEVGASKKDVIARHREIESRAGKKGESSGNDNTGDDTESGDLGNMFGDDNNDRGGDLNNNNNQQNGNRGKKGKKGGNQNGNQSSNHQNGGNGHNHNSCDHHNCHQHGAHQDFNNHVQTCYSCNQVHTSPYPAFDAFPNFDQGFNTHTQTATPYLPTASSSPAHLYTTHQGRLQPDHMWSQHDCDVLERLMHDYNCETWIQLQASFYNWTGRMVSPQLVEMKFRRDWRL